MINKRLIIGQASSFHFTWMNDEFKKHFREVIVTSDVNFPANEDDVLFVNACLGFYHHLKCRVKFGIMYPGFCFHPFKRPEQFDELKPIFAKYDAVFCNEGPVWESAKRDGTCKNFHLVPFCANTRDFKKTRTRDKFKRLIQVATQYTHKGRHIAREAMQLLPYEWELVPNDDFMSFVPYDQLPDIYQNADGFLHPGLIGPSPGYYVDGKYTAATCEAALSGCIIFWHDAMGIGNNMETVFEVSLNPEEIAAKIREVVGSIDLDKHSTRTAEEFRAKHNIEDTVKAKVKVMETFL